MSHYFVLVVVDPKDVGVEPGSDLLETFNDPARCERLENKVTELLAPFDENESVEPYRRYLDADDIERLRGNYNVPENAPLSALVPHVKDYYEKPSGLDDQGLYYISTYNPQSKWDWWVIGGRWDGEIRHNGTEVLDEAATQAYQAEVNAAAIAEGKEPMTKDQLAWYAKWKNNPNYDVFYAANKFANNTVWKEELTEDFSAYGIVTPDGEWHSKGRMGWFGMSSGDKKEWPFESAFIMSRWPGHLVVGCDLHI